MEILNGGLSRNSYLSVAESLACGERRGIFVSLRTSVDSLEDCHNHTCISVSPPSIHRSLPQSFTAYYGGNVTGSLDLLYRMTDSPVVQAPLDPQESPILDRVLYLRDKLSLLKQDKSTYVKSHDVLRLYDEVIEQVHQLNVIREKHGKPLEQNRGLSSTSVVRA